MFGVATLTVTASNNGSGNNTSNPQTTTISVIGINDPPTLNPINATHDRRELAATDGAIVGISAGINESQASP